MSWIDELTDLLFPLKGQQIKFEQAKILRFQNLPAHLYKYRAISERSLENLSTGTLWAARPRSLNDPADSRGYMNVQRLLLPALRFDQRNPSDSIDLPKEITREDLEEALSKDDFFDALIDMVIVKQPPGWKKIVTKSFRKSLKKVGHLLLRKMTDDFLEKFRDTVRIISLAEDYKSNVLWSYYGDGHKGMCIEYDIKAASRELPSVQFLFPVIYREGPLDFTNYMTELEQFNPLFPRFAAIVKLNSYRHELEWRVVAPADAFPEEQNIQMPPVTRVILGSKATEENSALVREIAEKKGIACCSLDIDSETGSLTMSNGA